MQVGLWGLARPTPQTLGGRQPSEDEQSGSGAAIAAGALLDGIPESVVLGLTLLCGAV